MTKICLESRKWFTLVELIVVITIIAILWAIWFLAFSAYIKQARDSDRISAVKELSIWVETFDSTSLKPTRLWLLKDLKKYPIDPSNSLGYQYNVNSAWKSVTNKNLWWKGYVICTSRPLEKYSDEDWNTDPKYLDAIDLIKDRKLFIDWKLQTKDWSKYKDVWINETMWYYCMWVTTDFSSLIAGGWSNSIWTQTCNTDLLNSTKDSKELWQACKIVLNMNYDNQAWGSSPSAWTPPALPSE